MAPYFWSIFFLTLPRILLVKCDRGGSKVDPESQMNYHPTDRSKISSDPSDRLPCTDSHMYLSEACQAGASPTKPLHTRWSCPIIDSFDKDNSAHVGLESGFGEARDVPGPNPKTVCYVGRQKKISNNVTDVKQITPHYQTNNKLSTHSVRVPVPCRPKGKVAASFGI